MFEVVGVILILLGTLMVLFGLAWLIRLAWKTRVWMGIATILTPPIGPLVFGLAKFQDSMKPLMMILVGLLLGAAPIWYGDIYHRYLGFAAQERQVNGEELLSLTGWKEKNYDRLKTATNVVRLEMGNPDVTDETLQLLLPMTKLKELTLDDSQITDAAFETLRKLPALESLRIQRTKITKEGVIQFLADPPPNLIQIDVGGNSIPASVLRKWKNQDPDHRKYVN